MVSRKTPVYVMNRDGWNDYFLLHVSKDTKAMRAHIEAVAKEEGWEVPHEGWEEIRGLVHPMISVDALYAHLFLAEDYLGAGIVAHECLHVAMAHERFVLRFKMAYGDNIGEDEERLAYYLTSVIKGVYNTLYDNGHIKKGKLW
jgi:hypothetical protein